MATAILGVSKCCTSCSTEKPPSEFGNHKIMKDGLMTVCRVCVAAKNKAAYQASKDERKVKSAAYRARTKEQKAEAASRYRAANKEKIAAAQATYRSKNAEKLKAGKAEWYQANKESCAERSATWHKENPERHLVHTQNRRALKKQGDGRISQGLTARLLALQKGRCACCKGDLKELGRHLDHIVPLSKGGAHEDANIQLLCPSCNTSKRDKLPHEFMRQRGYLI
jgi:5-methylcytosine-specific restriction endonuclease McrA